MLRALDETVAAVIFPTADQTAQGIVFEAAALDHSTVPDGLLLGKLPVAAAAESDSATIVR